MMKYARKKGYSLMEFVVMIMILTVLTGIAVPIYTESKASALRSRAKKELEVIASSAMSYYADLYTLSGTTIQKLNSEGYLSIINKDPWNNDYVYVENYLDADANNKPDVGSLVFTYSKGPNGASETNHSTGESSAGTDDLVVFILKID